MFTAAKASELQDGVEVEGSAQDIKAPNCNREPRYSTRRRKRTADSLADEAGFKLYEKLCCISDPFVFKHM